MSLPTDQNPGVNPLKRIGHALETGVARGALRTIPVTKVEQLFLMVARGRVDLALANDAVGYSMTRRYANLADIRPATKPSGEDVHYMAFSKRSPARLIIPSINRAISELRREGVIDQLIGRQ